MKIILAFILITYLNFRIELEYILERIKISLNFLKWFISK